MFISKKHISRRTMLQGESVRRWRFRSWSRCCRPWARQGREKPSVVRVGVHGNGARRRRQCEDRRR